MADAKTQRIKGSLIVAGVGAEDGFQDLIQTLGGIPTRMILVEPSETRGGRFAQTLANLDGIVVVDAVPADERGAVEIVEYNLPGLRAWAEPTAALTALFPGLKPRGRLATRKMPLAEAVSQLGELPPPLHLHIDLPGAESTILAALETGDLLRRLDRVSVRCGADTMFKDSWTSAAVQDWLLQRHFQLTETQDDDPDWPVLHFSADKTGRELDALKSEFTRLQAAHDAVDKERDDARKGRDTAAKERDEARATAEKYAAKVAELEAALAATREEATTTGERFEARIEELEAVRDSLTKERDDARKGHDAAAKERDEARATAEKYAAKVAEREAALAATREEASATGQRFEARIKELEAVRDSLTTERDAARKDRDTATKERDEIAKARDQAMAASDKAKDESSLAIAARDKAQADLGLAMRMQGLLQSDLDDLRDRFAQSEAVRREQEDLLRKLTPRLQEAAQQLRQLQMAEPPEPELLTPKPTRAKPRTTARKRTTRKKSADAK
ncbi:MAG: GAGA binding protein-like family [Rhodobacteraceae bacterium HLUCCA12]|nr:MAG: GAGA binding protein-like family [Rhodobacteraceae bacterium HLUCCA12]